MFFSCNGDDGEEGLPDPLPHLALGQIELITGRL